MGTDWSRLADALIAEGVAVGRVYKLPTFEGCGDSHCPQCRGMWAHLERDGREPRDLADPAVIFWLAEDWRERDSYNRTYEVHSARVRGEYVAAWAFVADEAKGFQSGAEAVDYRDSMSEALARALLAWAMD